MNNLSRFGLHWLWGILLTISASSVHGQTVSFVKHGNPGFESCDTFCANPIWGTVGTCLSATRDSDNQEISCSTVIAQPWIHRGGGHGPQVDEKVLCTCAAQSPFIKHGNNGTLSCNQYCSMSKWPGGVGGCSSATRTDNNQVIACSKTTGRLPEGQELSCECVARGWLR